MISGQTIEEVEATVSEVKQSRGVLTQALKAAFPNLVDTTLNADVLFEKKNPQGDAARDMHDCAHIFRKSIAIANGTQSEGNILNAAKVKKLTGSVTTLYRGGLSNLRAKVHSLHSCHNNPSKILLTDSEFHGLH